MQSVVALIQLVVADAERRQQINHIPEGTDQHALISHEAAEHLACRIEIPLLTVGDEIKGGDGAAEPDALHPGMVGQPLQPDLMALFELLMTGRVRFEQIQARIGRCAAEWVGREAVTMPQGFGWIAAEEFLKDCFAGHRDAHRQESGGESFG